ncbi:D-alanyl-D-alanine carboxypeptidase/D-alanyl-D-alanine carboxypeptidase (penicillin-binding protein 5/6) [Bartonella callosciuri]|uniref:D-alanyl-D-alanine carboxypeptidase/D-alanyl-D-alanine carboxypeptidase (Penicillin-binding protein 5/6) n=1 Tax=Bartonella callosciuri TaxID=686223 RepID=A0A840NVS5_9HYPH|nr:D-alanyl-D-alanine carboxypeptidase/D-alanyl-D-alanine carboxypeptidase (penicillin-binding protein 5/6) [Bartonella callosciuri]
MYINCRKIIRCYKKVAIVFVILALSYSWASATPPGAYPDKYAAIIIDANTGKILFQANSTLKRYPASLTKMMTLYMLFEAMHMGRVTPNTPIPVSHYATTRPPTKIGFKAGQTISAEVAAKALITRSANDVATAIAEYLGGSEKKFARMMTAKARKLGMMHTHFANASGLPDTRNYSTAQDMATLSLALRKNFPQQYKLFKTKSFIFRGHTINSHNKLVKVMKGVDGIKTGYTQMSGFNLATSMRSEGRSIVAVVMGGKSSTARDEHMANLLNQYLPKASQITRDGHLMASAHYKLPTGANTPIPTVKAEPNSFNDEISTILTAFAEQHKNSNAAIVAVNQAIIPIPNPQKTIPVETNKIVTASLSTNAGWAIQIGSLPGKEQARTLLLKAKNTAYSALKNVSSHMQLFEKSGHRYYRARFVGFQSKKAAFHACSTLKKANFNCYTIAY